MEACNIISNTPHVRYLESVQRRIVNLESEISDWRDAACLVVGPLSPCWADRRVSYDEASPL